MSRYNPQPPKQPTPDFYEQAMLSMANTLGETAIILDLNERGRLQISGMLDDIIKNIPRDIPPEERLQKHIRNLREDPDFKGNEHVQRIIDSLVMSSYMFGESQTKARELIKKRENTRKRSLLPITSKVLLGLGAFTGYASMDYNNRATHNLATQTSITQAADKIHSRVQQTETEMDNAVEQWNQKLTQLRDLKDGNELVFALEEQERINDFIQAIDSLKGREKTERLLAKSYGEHALLNHKASRDALAITVFTAALTIVIGLNRHKFNNDSTRKIAVDLIKDARDALFEATAREWERRGGKVDRPERQA